MCDSGLVIVTIVSATFVFLAFTVFFFSFDYNCNHFSDDTTANLVSPNLTTKCIKQKYLQDKKEMGQK